MTDTFEFPKDLNVMTQQGYDRATMTREDHDEIRQSKSPDAEAHKFTVTFEDGSAYVIIAELLIRPSFGFTKDKPAWVFHSPEWFDPEDNDPFLSPWHVNKAEGMVDVARGVYFEARMIHNNKDTYKRRDN